MASATGLPTANASLPMRTRSSTRPDRLGYWEREANDGPWVYRGRRPFPAPLFSPDGRLVAKEFFGHELYDTGGKLVSRIEGDRGFDPHVSQHAPLWSADAKHFVVRSRVHDTATGRLLWAFPNEVISVGWLGGRLLASSAYGRVEAFDLETGNPGGGVLAFFENDAWLVVGPDGHWRASADLAPHVGYQVETTDGKKEFLTPAEFENRYGWKNDPDQARLK